MKSFTNRLSLLIAILQCGSSGTVLGTTSISAVNVADGLFTPSPAPQALYSDYG